MAGKRIQVAHAAHARRRGARTPRTAPSADRSSGKRGLRLLVLALVLPVVTFLVQTLGPVPRPHAESLLDRDEPLEPAAAAVRQVRVQVLPAPSRQETTEPSLAEPNEAGTPVSAGSREASDRTRAAPVPRLEGRFAVPFPEYLAAVGRVGGRLVVFDEAQDRLVGWFEGQTLRRGFDMAGFSLNARDVTSDVPANLRATLFDQARALGAGVPRLLVVLPESVEARFVAGFRQALARQGLDLAEQDRVLFRYQRRDGELVAVIERVEVDGQAVALAEVVALWR